MKNIAAEYCSGLDESSIFCNLPSPICICASRPGAAPGKPSFEDPFECKMQNRICFDGASRQFRMLTGMRNWDLQLRTKRFALQVIEFCECLPNDETSRILKRQLLRAGTYVGANYRAACRTKSKPAFVSKMGDVLEETDECGYWIELLVEARKAREKAAAPLLREASGLVAISISSITTAKRNPGGEV